MRWLKTFGFVLKESRFEGLSQLKKELLIGGIDRRTYPLSNTTYIMAKYGGM